MAKKQNNYTTDYRSASGGSNNNAFNHTAAPAPKAGRKKPTAPVRTIHPRRVAGLTYGLGFLLLAVFCCCIYGPVFHHIGLDNYVCSDPEAMTFVRRFSAGTIYWAARYVLLVYKNQWLGGLLMAALLTLSAWLLDRLVPRSKAIYGLGFVPVILMLMWMVYRGYNLFLRCEISTFVVWTLCFFLVSLVLGLVGLFVHRREEASTRFSLFTLAPILPFCLYCGLTYQALVPGENVRASCKMQNLMAKADWEGMTEVALGCKQPSRSVAALYVISLVQQDMLLDRVFDIPYNYPKLKLDDIGGDDEGINYIADCNLHAGLANAAYHTSMENHVMVGPRLGNYKRMLMCALLNDEPDLAERLLHIIAQVPFEQDFVDEYRTYVGHRELLAQNETFATILKYAPRETKFEQNYRQPVFLGYNVGLMEGTDHTLCTSVATCMYSKDLNELLRRTAILQQKMSLPLSVQQSIAVASLNRDNLLDSYPQVKGNQMLLMELRNFINDAKPFVEKQKAAANDEEKDAVRKEMADALRENWLGSYYYYYYCGNIDQTVKKTVSHGVN